jgi:hypothetical protein
MTPTRGEAIQAAAEVYGAILANPERREEIRRALAEKATQTAARPAPQRLAEQRNTRKSA